MAKNDKTDLTPMQEQFAQEYVKTGNASEAFRRVYKVDKMKIETIHRRAHDVVTNSKVKARIQAIQDDVYDKNIMGLKEAYSRIAEIARNDNQEAKDVLKALDMIVKVNGGYEKNNEQKAEKSTIIIQGIEDIKL